MKPFSFLLDTLWVGYALYFRPLSLERYLRAQLPDLEPYENPIRLWYVLDKRKESASLRYMAQVALLCALATIPFLLLAPIAPEPPALLAIGLTWLLIWLCGFGIAFLDATAGLGVAVTLAILLGTRATPAQWLVAATDSQLMDLIRGIVIPGTLIGLVAGMCLGLIANLLVRRAIRAQRLTTTTFQTMIDIGLVSLISFTFAGIVILLPAVVTEYSAESAAHMARRGIIVVAVLVLIGMVLGVIGNARIAKPLKKQDAIVGAVVTAVVLGIGCGVVVGVSGGVMIGIEGTTADPDTNVGWLLLVQIVAVAIVALGLTSITTLSVLLGVVLGTSGLWASALASAVLGMIALAVTLAVGSVVAVLPSYSVWKLIIVAVLMGISLGSRDWKIPIFLSSFGFLSFISLAFLPQQPVVAAIWLTVAVAGFFRLPITGLEAAGSALTLLIVRGRLTSSLIGRYSAMNLFVPVWRWDEVIPVPIPLLDRNLVWAVQKDRRTGLALIEEVAGTWRQGVMAQRALMQLTAEELAQCNDEQLIAAAARGLVWLPEIPSPTVQGTLGRFRTVSVMLDEKRSLTDSEAQLAQLGRTTAALDNMIQGLTFVPRRERELFLPVALQWRDILRRATIRLPNPYVAGDPLRGDQPGLFVGREDVMRDLLVHLADRSQRPTLVLFGQRRMGKSSLLYQLPHKFDDQTVPVHVDCQAAEMQENNAGFLFNLARIVHRQAKEFREIQFSPPPTLAEMTATAFSQWLETVEDQLGERVLLLCLDEFERIGEAVNRGWLDERILDFLRNLIQHHPQVTLLLAGSHRPEAIGRPWSDYLISAAVLPISYLQPVDVEELVKKPIPGFPLHYRPEAVQRIIELTRCQPLLVQLLCQQLVILLNERGEREAGVAEIEAAVPGALSQGGSLYFTYLAEYDAGDEGKAMLRELARKGPGAVLPENTLTHEQPASQEALRRLLARDLVEHVDGGIRFEVELTRRWWAEYGEDS